MLSKVFIRNVYFGGYLNETRHAFIVYMFRRRPEVLHSVGDNALISGFGKGPVDLVTKPSSHPNHQACLWYGVQNGKKCNRVIQGK